jgi:FSR family fosmidomycin resistance protein-like MFS transporter
VDQKLSGARESKGNSYLAFLASSHFAIHVYSMLLPVLLLPLQDELGVSLVQVSLLASVPRLLNVFFYIPVGLASDRYPSQILTLSFAVTTVGALVIPMARGFPLLLLGFLLLSIGTTLYHPPSLMMASEYDPRKRSFALGFHNVGSSIGFAAGPLLMGYLLNDWGWRSSFYVWAVLSVAMVGVTYVYTRKTLKSGESSRNGFDLRGGFGTLLTRGFLLVVAMSTIVEMTFNIIVTFMPAYFTTQLGMSYSLSSTVSGLGPLMGLAGSFLGGFIGMRYGVRRMGILVLALIAALLAVFPGVSALRTVLVAYGVTRLLLSTYMPLMNSMIADNSNPENRSLAYSTNFVAVSLITSLSTTGTSMLIEAFDASVIFPMCLAVLVPCIAIIYLLMRQEKNRGLKIETSGQ